MDVFENKFVYTDHGFQKHCRCWYRYIDDIFAIWTGQHSDLMDFVNRLNGSIACIQFTVHCYIVSIPFLDVMIKSTTEGHLETDLFVKHTDKNTLLRYDSFHPPHIKTSLPRIIKKDWNLLTNHFPNKVEFKSPPRMSYTRAETIGARLVKADLGPAVGPKQTFLKTPKNGTFPCCGYNHCSNVLKGNCVYHPLKGTRIPIRGFYTCASTYVVYSIKCPCGKTYVGKTICCIRDRLTEHKSAIRNKRNQPIAKHFK
ncbi:hypothetical protein XELAEV_18020331mg [Xenopus laevis]|uniref:GIY-YIG domain-containing protein n=1 Tax=Xenopus laevis TaxID=8355 RepID=A0A974D9J4_XENLA|nr:hypothetical protein XELAEV_18020331mg [Xenopus laevis]